MVAGVPGVGKSRTLKHFTEQEGYDALYLSIVDGEGKPTAVATNLLRLFREKSNGLSLSEMRERLMSYIGRGRVIILDEAQYLERQGAEWVRGLAESGDIDLVLAGDPMLHALVAKVPQLYSRMLRPILIKEVLREDVQAMVEGTAFDTDWAVDGLHSVARLKGGLRNVDNVTRIALLFAGQERPNRSRPSRWCNLSGGRRS